MIFWRGRGKSIRFHVTWIDEYLSYDDYFHKGIIDLKYLLGHKNPDLIIEQLSNKLRVFL